MGKGELLMWTYNKTLQYPINIKCPDPKLAKVIISQYGGPDAILILLLKINYYFFPSHKPVFSIVYGLGNL